MSTSCIHGQDPGKLSNSAKWPKAPPAKNKRCEAVGGSQLWAVSRQSTINKGKVVNTAGSSPSLLRSFLRFRVTLLFQVLRGGHPTKGDFPYKHPPQKSNSAVFRDSPMSADPQIIIIPK